MKLWETEYYCTPTSLVWMTRAFLSFVAAKRPPNRVAENWGMPYSKAEP